MTDSTLNRRSFIVIEELARHPHEPLRTLAQNALDALSQAAADAEAALVTHRTQVAAARSAYEVAKRDAYSGTTDTAKVQALKDAETALVALGVDA